MLIKRFVNHSIKNFSRNRYFKTNIFVILISIICYSFLLTILFLVGYYFKNIMNYLNIIEYEKVVNQFIFYFFMVSFVYNLFFSPNIHISLKPYMVLNIKKKKMINYIIIKSIVSSFVNISAIFLFFPLGIKFIIPNYSILFFVIWFADILSITLLLSIYSIYLREVLNRDIKLFLILISVFIGLVLAINCINFHIIFFSNIQNYNIKLLSPTPIFVFCYYLLYTYIKNNLFINNTSNKGKLGKHKIKFDCKSKLRHYFILEFKLIFRNKFIRILFYTSIYLLVYLSFILLSNSSKWLDNNKYHYIVLFSYSLFNIFSFQYFIRNLSIKSIFFPFILLHFDIKKYFTNILLLNGIYQSFIFLFNFFILQIILDQTIITYIFPIFCFSFGFINFWTIFCSIIRPNKIPIHSNLGFHRTKDTSLISMLLFVLPLIIIMILSFSINFEVLRLLLYLVSFISMLLYRQWFKMLKKSILQKKYLIISEFSR